MNAAGLEELLAHMRAEALANSKKMQEERSTESVLVACGLSIVQTSLFLAEIALQLAKLNEKLEPQAIFNAVNIVQKLVDKAEDDERGSR